jgi:hypothetical protein
MYWPSHGTPATGRAPLAGQRSESIADVDRELTVGEQPIDGADVRNAFTHLIGAYTAQHYRLPSKAAVRDVG